MNDDGGTRNMYVHMYVHAEVCNVGGPTLLLTTSTSIHRVQ